jgi:hypothetical protein
LPHSEERCSGPHSVGRYGEDVRLGTLLCNDAHPLFCGMSSIFSLSSTGFNLLQPSLNPIFPLKSGFKL